MKQWDIVIQSEFILTVLQRMHTSRPVKRQLSKLKANKHFIQI